MKKTIVDALAYCAVLAIVGGAGIILLMTSARHDKQDAATTIANEVRRRNAICPALMSISRSARDTLIVMKAEPLCNSFVLDNLK